MINNLDLVSHLGLYVVWMDYDMCIGSDLVRNMILGLYALGVLDCILVKGMTQKTSFIKLPSNSSTMCYLKVRCQDLRFLSSCVFDEHSNFIDDFTHQNWFL